MDLRRLPGPAVGGAALLAAVLALFFDVVAGGESFFGRDAAPFFYPMKRYLADALAAGRFPLWNPLVANGEPFFASLQPGVLYPGSLVLLLLPFPASVDWLIVLHFMFAGLGWALLLRSEGLPPAAVAFGAMAFMLGGFFVSLGNFVNNLQAMAWTPWLMLTWSLYLRDRTIGRLLVFSACCVAAFLAGEPQILALVLGITLLYGVLHGALHGADRRGFGAQLTAFTAAGILALLVASVQLVPFLEYLGQSVRRLPLEIDFAVRLSQEPSGLLHLVLPPVYAHGDLGFTTRHLASHRAPWLLSLYPGIVVAAFWIVGLLRERPRVALTWGGLAIAGLLLALGPHTPVFPALFEALPPLRAVRYPEKFALLGAVGVPILAGRGFAAWLGDERAGVRGVGVILAVLAIGYGAAALILSSESDAFAFLCGGSRRALLCGNVESSTALYAVSSLRLALVAAASAGLVVAVRRHWMEGRWAAWLLVGLAAADLVTAHTGVNPSVDRDVYTGRPWVADVLAAREDRERPHRFRGTPVAATMGSTARVRGAADLSNIYLDRQALGPNAGQAFGVHQQDGLQGVELLTTAWLQAAAPASGGEAAVRYLRRGGVRYYADATADASTMTGLEPIGRHPDLPIQLWEVPEPNPRAFIAAGWDVASGPRASLARFLDAGQPDRRVVLEAEPRMARAAASDPPGRIVAATWRPERVRLVSRTHAPAMIVLLDTWYPGWRVTVNGTPAPLLRAGGVYRAVEVPAGEADVEFRYRPRSIPIGAALSGVGLFIGLLLAIVARRRRA